MHICIVLSDIFQLLCWLVAAGATSLMVPHPYIEIHQCLFFLHLHPALPRLTSLYTECRGGFICSLIVPWAALISPSFVHTYMYIYTRIRGILSCLSPTKHTSHTRHTTFFLPRQFLFLSHFAPFRCCIRYTRILWSFDNLRALKLELLVKNKEPLCKGYLCM